MPVTSYEVPDGFTDAVRAWVGEGRTIVAECFDDASILARAVMRSFWAENPQWKAKDEGTAVSQLHAIAHACGHTDPGRLISGGVIGGEGEMTLHLRLKDD